MSDWRDHSDAGFTERPVGIYAGAQEVLDGTDHHRPAAAGRAHRSVSGLRGRTVYLYAVLITQNQTEALLMVEIIHNSKARIIYGHLNWICMEGQLGWVSSN